MLIGRQKWTLTQDALDKLLVAFGGDRESAGQKYLEIRTNLTRFFEWRGCAFPDDHADETINRMAKRVAEGEAILNHSGYAMGVARLLLLEINKGRQREQSALAEMGAMPDVYVPEDDGESRLECLRSCLQTLSPENRELIFEPYFSTKAEGVGLGLSIVGEIVSDYYEGSLELLKSGPLKGANFLITLKKRV